MEKNAYIINLRDQQNAMETYGWTVTDAFFAGMQDAQIQQGTVQIDLCVERLAGNSYDLHFALSGQVAVPCDRCLEPMSQGIDGETTLRVVLGAEDCDDGEVITVPEERGTIDLRWNIYEQVVLQVPMRHVHLEGECTGELSEALRQFEVQAETEETEEKPTDPRWDALKGILNNK